MVEREIDALPGPVSDALPEPIVRARWRREVDGEVGDRRMRRGHGAGDDAEEPDVGREIVIGLLE